MPRKLDDLAFIEASWIGKIQAIETLILSCSDFTMPKSIYTEMEPCLALLKKARDKIQADYDFNGAGARRED